MKRKNNIALFLLILASFNFFKVNAQNFTLPKLSYQYKDLEPFIDSQTMVIHYTKHHQAYVDKLNKALLGSKFENQTLEELFLKTSEVGDIIQNNAGGYYNHSLFWEILTPIKNTKPSKVLETEIKKTYTSLDSLKKILNQTASTRFGSGWAWLIVTPDKKLKVCSTPNQDNPLMETNPDRGIPILAIDVWEHAYYLKYQNKRADYLDAIWNVINWKAVSKKYEEALKSPLLKKMQ